MSASVSDVRAEEVQVRQASQPGAGRLHDSATSAQPRQHAAMRRARRAYVESGGAGRGGTARPSPTSAASRLRRSSLAARQSVDVSAHVSAVRQALKPSRKRSVSKCQLFFSLWRRCGLLKRGAGAAWCRTRAWWRGRSGQRHPRSPPCETSRGPVAAEGQRPENTQELSAHVVLTH